MAVLVWARRDRVGFHWLRRVRTPTSLSWTRRARVYVVGVAGGKFPITGNAALTTILSGGTFAAKLSGDGTRLLYSTYLPLAKIGGVAVDSQGNAHITF